MTTGSTQAASMNVPKTRSYQQELLDQSLHRNLIIALDTGSGKTHIAVLRMKAEAEKENKKVSWFLAPTVALCEQQRNVISLSLPVSVGLISGALEPDQWKDSALWRRVLDEHRIVVSTPQVLLDALRHGYVSLGLDISLVIFDEAHHAIRDHPYNAIMKEHYFILPPRQSNSNAFERPALLGLTASPIYGSGAVDQSLRAIEANLDSVVRTARRHRDELEKFVHRPVFRHIMYTALEYDPTYTTSRNLSSLIDVLEELNIDNDPYVQSLRAQLARETRGSPRWKQLDQKLSKTIHKQSTYTHKGLREFANAAQAIYWDCGEWAADWYVQTVLEQARAAASPYDTIVSIWQDKEKTYLREQLAKIEVVPVSFQPARVIQGSTSKVKALVECLVAEKANTEAQGESYRSLVFVKRRDTVIALAAVLAHYPGTAGVFDVGRLVGSLESSYRQSLLDIVRRLLSRSQTETLSDFAIGESNLVIATSVAEEGIDIQECGSVIRWDPPENLVSWAQSRGRARRKKSTFTLLLDDSDSHRDLINRWTQLEQNILRAYSDPRRDDLRDEDGDLNDLDEEYREFRLDSTGAVVTLDSVVAHLNHFCAVIPSTSHGNHLPVYEIDPPDLPDEWHLTQARHDPLPYPGPFGCTVTLPRLLPPELRVFAVERKYDTKRSAQRNAAFEAYIALYHAGLLNEHLLPLMSVLEPELEEEVKTLLKDIDARSGTTGVSVQMDPFSSDQSFSWRSSRLQLGDSKPVKLLTRAVMPAVDSQTPVLFLANGKSLSITCHPETAKFCSTAQTVDDARLYTRRLFWQFYGSRMDKNRLDFSYMVSFQDNEAVSRWSSRLNWLHDTHRGLSTLTPYANAETFGVKFDHPSDITIVRAKGREGQLYRFLGWQTQGVSLERSDELVSRYTAYDPHYRVSMPLLMVEPFPRKRYFLVPPDSRVQLEMTSVSATKSVELLDPRYATVDVVSPEETLLALLMPSVIRYLSMTLTAMSLRETLFASTAMSSIPLELLLTAITAPVTQERTNYQRLETLGDCALKFCVSIQLLSEFPLWHEGYLSRRKDHAVSNVKLAQEAVKKELYRWIIRDRGVSKKWTPKLDRAESVRSEEAVPTDANTARPRTKQELSTKVLADVVESLIGASYESGGFDSAVQCAELFGLGLKWEKLGPRIDVILSRVVVVDAIPSQVTLVESLLGYTFQRKALLVEALMHASYQQDLSTVSYERMEFMGDAALDMVVTDYLYHAPGKRYSPGHIHNRKAAVVNAHFLAFICLRRRIDIDSSMPRAKDGLVVLESDEQSVYLYRCLLHSSHKILEDQALTFARFQRVESHINKALKEGTVFPWAALTSLQAPKFLSDMIESLIGAAYLDSKGNLDVVREILSVLGFMEIFQRIVEDDVDVFHPLSRMMEWASKQDEPREVKYEITRQKGKVTCVLLVDGEPFSEAETAWRGRASQDEVKFAAAEEAIRKLELADLAEPEIYEDDVVEATD